AALTLYRQLELLYEAHPDARFHDMAKNARDRVTALQMYAPAVYKKQLRAQSEKQGTELPDGAITAPVPWQTRLAGVTPGMMREALEDAARYHVNARGYRSLITGAIDRVQMLIDMKELVQTF